MYKILTITDYRVNITTIFELLKTSAARVILKNKPVLTLYMVYKKINKYLVG